MIHTMGGVPGLARWTMAAALAVSLAGCVRARPAVEPDLPPLAVPLPPSRLLPPLEGGPIEGTTRAVAEEPPASPRPAPRRREPRPPAPAVQAEAPRVEPPAEAPPAADPVPAPPPPVLQLSPPGEEGRVQQEVRRQLTQADRDLSRVDYRALGADARAQYETAKRFAHLAEQALKDRNLVFAQTLADKAAAIAAVLAR